jgi:single-strand DNA-binding protein
MSRGFSRIVLVGNLGRDPEMRYSQSGTPITNFTIAVNRRRRDQNGNYQDETDWFRVTLFRQQAEMAAEWLKKGSKVLVEGQFQLRTFTGNDGVERTTAEVNADNFMNLTPRDDAGMGGGYQPRERDSAAPSAPTPTGGPASPATGGARKQPGTPFDDDNDDFDDVPF